MTMTWGDPGGTNGFVIDASTDPNFTGTILSSATADPSVLSLAVSGLVPNTTYFLQAGALYGGATTYSTQVSTMSTLANSLLNVLVYQVNAGSITVNWTAFSAGSGTNTTEGYLLNASTASNFIGTIYVSSNATPATSTLTVTGLTGSTTYYLRAGAINWAGVSNFVAIGSVTTLSGGGLPAPTGLIGTGTSVSNINWVWNLVGGATGYNVYMASSPFTLTGTTTTTSWVDIGLPQNAPIGHRVTAEGPGQHSPLSGSATTYTLANQPGAATSSSVGSSSFTITWGTSGNPGNTQYQIEMALNSSFSVGISTPIPFANNLIGNTTNVIGLSANTSYFVRVRARNGNNIPTGPTAPITVTTQQNGTGSTNGSGLGSAGLAPSSVPRGGIVTSTLTYTVPAGGMGPGARIEITLPSGWWPNNLQNTSASQDGYVTATSTAAVSFNLTFASTLPVVTVSFSAGTLSPGTTIQVTFNNIHPNCPPPNQAHVTWEVKSAMLAADLLGDIASQPSQTFSAGQGQWVGYNPWNTLTVIANQPSQAIFLQANDNCVFDHKPAGVFARRINGRSRRPILRHLQFQRSGDFCRDSFRQFDNGLLLQNIQSRQQCPDLWIVFVTRNGSRSAIRTFGQCPAECANL